MDPSPSKSTDEFFKEYTIAYGRAIAYQEIYNMIESAEKMVKSLTDQIEKPDKNYEI